MKITKGLNIPITGEPVQTLPHDLEKNSPKVRSIAILGRDFHGLKPSMKVKVGDHVKIGQTLFTDKKNPGVNFTARGSGKVTHIHRGAKRVLQSIIIDVDDEEEMVDFPAYTTEEITQLPVDDIRKQLQASGAWTAFRTRPYSKVPQADSQPAHIFVTAMDTTPLSADPAPIISHYAESFSLGLDILARLTSGKVFVCHETGKTLPGSQADNVKFEDFSGPHPAGLPGTHIHMLTPVDEQSMVWHMNYQDVIALSRFFLTGKLFQERIIALAGPKVKKPRLIKARIGACTNDIVQGELIPGENMRVISGSVLGGYRAAGWSAYLGRYDLQVSVLAEGEPRKLLHWVNPFLNMFSVFNVFANQKRSTKTFAFSTSQQGSPRAMVPLGAYEDIMPLDILPTQLLRALLIRDTETAKMLGALELDESDLALCTFVCHSKYEYGPALRECLEMIERDG